MNPNKPLENEKLKKPSKTTESYKPSPNVPNNIPEFQPFEYDKDQLYSHIFSLVELISASRGYMELGPLNNMKETIKQVNYQRIKISVPLAF
jgi:hypothetical protein